MIVDCIFSNLPKCLIFHKSILRNKYRGLVNLVNKLSKGVRLIVQMKDSSFDKSSMRDVHTSHSILYSIFSCKNRS
jgi:hypothetical protein